MGNNTNRGTCGGARPPEVTGINDEDPEPELSGPIMMACFDPVHKKLQQQLKEKEEEIERLRGLIK